jgi:tetratricopeptide (TPR) repeat protein
VRKLLVFVVVVLAGCSAQDAEPEEAAVPDPVASLTAPQQSDDPLPKLTEAVTKHPQDAAGYRQRGDYFSQQGDFDKAIADYDAALRLAPDAKTYQARGVAHGSRGETRMRPRTTIAVLLIAARATPSRPSAIWAKPCVWTRPIRRRTSPVP